MRRLLAQADLLDGDIPTRRHKRRILTGPIPAKPKVNRPTTGSGRNASRMMCALRAKAPTITPRAGPADIGTGDIRTMDGRRHMAGQPARQRAGSCAASPVPRALPDAVRPYAGPDSPPGGGPGPSARSPRISLNVSWVMALRRRDRDSPGMIGLSRILAITHALKTISE